MKMMEFECRSVLSHLNWSTHRAGQRGVTLVDLAMAMAVTAIISTAIVSSIAQVFDSNARNSNHMIAVRQVQNAGYWISHDSQMAQNVSAAGNLVFSWKDWDGSPRQATYSLVGTDLRRVYTVDNVTQANALVGQHISAAAWPYSISSKRLAFTVTATVGTGSRTSSETRSYEVAPRPAS
jgi:Tfp pilus assembly protein PilE